MAVLVTGGAGYIGSVTVDLLKAVGEEVVVLDNLSRGQRSAVDADVPFYEGDVGDTDLVKCAVEENGVDACIHFAAFAYVGESVDEPCRYFENNVAQGIRLLNALVETGVRKFVFSSTCATYGEPRIIPIDEQHPQQPTNPYGLSKLFVERILEAYDAAYGLRFAALRYFNAAGGTTKRTECHDPETHLIPNVLAAAERTSPFVEIYGDDYPTDDGTCIRDYIHVSDLADAHIRALRHLTDGKDSVRLNLGNGAGYSVREVIRVTESVTGAPIQTRVKPRRPGDPSQLVADAAMALEVLGWKPQFADLETIIRSAWESRQR